MVSLYTSLAGSAGEGFQSLVAKGLDRGNAVPPTCRKAPVGIWPFDLIGTICSAEADTGDLYSCVAANLR